MATHIGVLPVDVIDTIQQQIENAENPAATFIRLPHPRTGVSSLFLPYLLTKSSSSSRFKWGILEVQSVSPPNQRSWFLGEDQVVADGKLLLMTPMDPAFLLIPLLLSVKPAEGSGVFQPLDDMFEYVTRTLGPDITREDVFRLINLDCVAGAMRRVCEVRDVTSDMTVYRYSEDKLMEWLKGKVAHLSTPAVTELSRTIVRELAKDGLMEDGQESLLELGRTKAACNLLSQYLPPEVYTMLLGLYDFRPLEAHVNAIRAEAAAAAAPPAKKKDTNTTPTAEKRKAVKGSTGVEKLKKANTKGMQKLSSFFTKN